MAGEQRHSEAWPGLIWPWDLEEKMEPVMKENMCRAETRDPSGSESRAVFLKVCSLEAWARNTCNVKRGSGSQMLLGKAEWGEALPFTAGCLGAL